MKQLKDLCTIVLGNFLLAVAVVFFILPENILSGGVATVALILQPITHISSIVLIAVVNIGLFVVGALCLGKNFALRSILSTFLYPLFTSMLSYVDPRVFEGVNPILSALFAGLICGLGLGLVFRVDGSTGGMDIPALIMHKFLGIPQGTAVLIVDTLTIVPGFFLYGLNAVLTGLLGVAACSYAISRVQTMGGQSAFNIMIISNEYEKVKSYLLEDISRGVTILNGYGAWSKQERPVLMCVVSTREYARIESGISAIDPRAFIIVNSVHEVHGSGFTYKDGTL